MTHPNTAPALAVTTGSQELTVAQASEVATSSGPARAAARLPLGAEGVAKTVETLWSISTGVGQEVTIDPLLNGALLIEPPENWSDTVYAANFGAVSDALKAGILTTAHPLACLTGTQDHGLLPDRSVFERLKEVRHLSDWACRELSDLALAGAPLSFDTALADRIFWGSGPDLALGRLKETIKAALPYAVTHVVMTPWLDSGGAELLALWHAQAVDADKGRTLVIGTDGSKSGWADRLPESAVYVSLPDVLLEAGLAGQFAADDIADTLSFVLSEMSFNVLHVINSYIGYRMLRSNLGWEDRSIFVSLFGVGRDEHGLEAGYWFSARDLKEVRLFLTDNALLIETRASGFGLLPDHILPIYYPTPATQKYMQPVTEDTRGHSRRRVLWASRLDAEKLPGLVFEIAQLMPHVEFHMFGRQILGDAELGSPPSNVVLRGAFDGWSSLPDEAFDCFLFTSQWEGMPNIILEAMGSGIPLVASNVGAISESLTRERGWLIDDVYQPAGYVEAIQEVLDNPASARGRADCALRYIQTTRSFGYFMDQLRTIGYL